MVRWRRNASCFMVSIFACFPLGHTARSTQGIYYILASTPMSLFLGQVPTLLNAAPRLNFAT